MKGKIITISENCKVSVPDNVQMRDFEIAELFGVMIPTIRSNIRTILKLGVVVTDAQHGGTFFGNISYPDYYGLDIIVALAFRIQSPQAEAFRKWMLRKLIEKDWGVNTQIFIPLNIKRNKTPN